MNKAQKTLLKELREDSRETELLSSVKKSVDPLGRLHGDPKFKAEISITIHTLFADAVGLIAPAALPPALQIPIPVYLLGLTDFYGGYLQSNTLAPLNIWVMNGLGIWNTQAAAFFIRGDLWYTAQANIGGVVYTLYVWIHCNNVAYGTFLNSFVLDLIILNQIQYSVPIANLNQLLNPLIFGTQSLFGKVVTGTIDPHTYITNQTFNQQIANIPITLPIDKSLMLCSYLEFDCQNINFIFQVQKVKPLTFH